jgi:hypothetical protein
MRIIVNHITRMSGARVCIAGVDADTFEHVRPTTPQSDLITRTLLRSNGGPFGIGTLVELGSVTPCPNAPETEDHRFVTREATYVEELTAENYLQMLEEISAPTLSAAMGPELQRMNNDKWAIGVGCGTRSLAVLHPQGRPRLRIDFEKPRLHLSYPDDRANLSVADVRFYEADHKTARVGVVHDVNARLANGVDAYIMLGLSRPFAGSEDREFHWLQVNGVCLADRPVGDVP